jgi:hypothetical protein
VFAHFLPPNAFGLAVAEHIDGTTADDFSRFSADRQGRFHLSVSHDQCVISRKGLC